MTDHDAKDALDLQRCSFFFDLDGTLAELQPRPEQVFIPSATLLALARFQAEGIPVAVVSGRQLQDIDRLLAPLQLPAAGVHGAERRHGDGQISRLAIDPQVFQEIQEALIAACRNYPGAYLENKGMAFALHYRQAPDLQEPLRALAEDFVNRHADHLMLQPGKCVYELKPRGASKGEAIKAFMQELPFLGRQPVFLGDDLTDEAGFKVVNQCGGLSIKIGSGETEACQRLDSVADVSKWLTGLLVLLDERPLSFSYKK
ncbi:trehalose-phosphatase [Azomonas macrocytogenes]|nr:trehalose-phosphatase [Azomonas macrocytogenes]